MYVLYFSVNGCVCFVFCVALRVWQCLWIVWGNNPKYVWVWLLFCCWMLWSCLVWSGKILQFLCILPFGMLCLSAITMMFVKFCWQYVCWWVWWSKQILSLLSSPRCPIVYCGRHRGDIWWRCFVVWCLALSLVGYV